MASEAQALDVEVKRAFEAPSRDDGMRVLVDRLWPRGLRKKDAAIDLWRKELAPSTELRVWFGHKPERWDEFKRRYEAELSHQTTLLEELRQTAARNRLTLVYAARDETHNQAVILREILVGANPPIAGQPHSNGAAESGSHPISRNR